MPFYKSTYLPGTIYTKTNPNVSLEEFCASDSTHYSPPKLVSRLVRETSCKWVKENLYSAKDAEELKLGLALALEMIVACDFAKERLSECVVVKLALLDCIDGINKVEEEKRKTLGLDDLAHYILEIHTHIEKEKKFPIDNPLCYVVWGQSLIQLARFFHPRGAKQFGKTEYMSCLDEASRLFNQCLKVISPNTKFTNINPAPEHKQLGVDALCGAGYVSLLKARVTNDASSKKNLLNEAKQLFIAVENYHQLNPVNTDNSTYNLACVYALLEQDEECKRYLNESKIRSILPPSVYLEKDADLENVKSKPWFSSFLPSSNVSNDHQQQPKVQNVGIRYTDDDALNDAITYDEELNKLQASLLREGFSMGDVVGMVLEIGKQKKKVEADNIKNEENRQRLNERLKKVNLHEKRCIPGDGNCQFYSLSDQIYDDLDHAAELRKQSVEWLRSHKDWQLPNGAYLSDFACDTTWEELCEQLSRNGIWGNHLTLVAIAEIFGHKIRIISSVKSGAFIVSIDPTKVEKNKKILLLSHYAEYHYGSLCSIDSK